MKKVLSVVLAFSIMLAFSVTVFAKADNPFVDVSREAWYHDEIVAAVETGIINGKTTTEFMPDDLLTYAEAIKLAACMNQVYLSGKVTLAPGEPWYATYDEYCRKNGIISKKYNYNESATRAGYMEIFANALPNSAFEDINNVKDGSILDVKENAPYAIYVYKLYRAGIVTGVDEKHNCNPEDNIKRCEVAAIISRMMDEEKRVKFDMPGEENNSENGDASDDLDIAEKPNVEVKPEPDDEPVLSGDDVEINKEHESVVVKPVFEKPEFNTGEEYTLSVLTVYKQPEGGEYDEYGIKHEMEVIVYGGSAPYTYQWQYNGYKNQKTAIKDGDYVSGADTNKLILSVEAENILSGEGISCKITDSKGEAVVSDTVKVYGPFWMMADDVLSDNGEYTIVGRVADGKIKKGEKISVIRDGKVIAIGIASDLQMFNKSMDEGVKGDNMGIVFKSEAGVRPKSGDKVVKYMEGHVIDTSDIVN